MPARLHSRCADSKPLLRVPDVIRLSVPVVDELANDPLGLGQPRCEGVVVSSKLATIRKGR